MRLILQRRMETNVLDSEKSQKDLKDKDDVIEDLRKEVSSLKVEIDNLTLENSNLNNNCNKILVTMQDIMD